MSPIPGILSVPKTVQPGLLGQFLIGSGVTGVDTDTLLSHGFDLNLPRGTPFVGVAQAQGTGYSAQRALLTDGLIASRITPTLRLILKGAEDIVGPVDRKKRTLFPIPLPQAPDWSIQSFNRVWVRRLELRGEEARTNLVFSSELKRYQMVSVAKRFHHDEGGEDRVSQVMQVDSEREVVETAFYYFHWTDQSLRTLFGMGNEVPLWQVAQEVAARICLYGPHPLDRMKMATVIGRDPEVQEEERDLEFSAGRLSAPPDDLDLTKPEINRIEIYSPGTFYAADLSLHSIPDAHLVKVTAHCNRGSGHQWITAMIRRAKGREVPSLLMLKADLVHHLVDADWAEILYPTEAPPA